MEILKVALSKFWQLFSYLLVAYGYYLIFLFFYDTYLRIFKPFAFPLALITTLIFLFVGAVIWLKDKLLKWVKR